LFLKYGRRWKKHCQAWKKKTRISRSAQSNLPDIDSTKTPASGFVPPEVNHEPHSQSTQRDELEPVNISQTDGDIAESNHIEGAHAKRDYIAADQGRKEPLLGHSSPGSKSGGAEVLQASASKPFTASGSTGESGSNSGHETNPQTKSLPPSLSGRENPDDPIPSEEGAGIELPPLDGSIPNSAHRGVPPPPETDPELEGQEKEKQEEEKRKKDKGKLMAWLREVRKDYDSHRHYDFLGECYIHGMMDGEAMASQRNEGCRLHE
jgi:hypothetical protein